MPTQTRKPPGYPIESVGNALQLLLLFRERESARVADISDELGVGRSTAHRLVKMLEHFDLVRQDEDTKSYRAGPALWEIGIAVIRNMDLISSLPPYLDELASLTGETSHLAVLRGGDVRFIAATESSAPLKTGSRIGRTFPAYATAAGKVLLANLSEEQLILRYPNEELEPQTDHTLRSRTELLAELRRIRRRGFGTTFEENQEEICAVAVPLQDLGRGVPSSLGISAPASRLRKSDAAALAAIIAGVAERAMDQLSYRSMD